MRLPKLIVFDLDFTLWDCDGTWCDCLCPPLELRNGKVIDSRGREVRLYPDVHAILDECDSKSIPIALASRTEQPAWARELIELLGIHTRFAEAEIYPSSKRKHFAALHKSTGIAYEEMLFFDDEMRNIAECSALGVTCVHVENGFDKRLFEDGLRRFAS